MPDINGIPYVESTDLVSAYPAASQALAQEVSDQLASKLPYSYGTATPSTSVDGFLWYDENDTPPTPKYWNGSSFATLAPAPGLELVTSDTFSAVSSVSVDGCFSATYGKYFVTVKGTQSTTALGRLRLRASGSDLTSSTYLNARATYQSGASIGGFAATETSIFAFYAANTGAFSITAFISDVFAADLTHVEVSGVGIAPYWLHCQSLVNNSTSYDGFTLFPDSGTISGTIYVYGYKD